MPKTTPLLVSEINEMLRRKGGEVLTMPWPDFYELADLERFKAGREEAIKKEARDRYGLILSFGRTIVLAAHDRNFAPAV